MHPRPDTSVEGTQRRQARPAATDGADLRATFLVHLSDFTTDRSIDRERVDQDFLDRATGRPEDVSSFVPRGDDILASRSAAGRPSPRS
jgi:hypothetical protein